MIDRESSWIDEAACATHPLRKKHAWDFDKPKHRKEAINVCETMCPVRQQCLEYAQKDPGAEGIHGGLLFRVRPKRGHDASESSEV